MTGPELDALIVRTDKRCTHGQDSPWHEVMALNRELKIYRAMALRLERCVHELVKEAEG